MIPALNEADNLAVLLPQLRDLLRVLGIDGEILVVTRGADERSRAVAAEAGATIIEQSEPGYGGALIAGFGRARIARRW